MNILFGMPHLNILDGMLLSILLYMIAICVLISSVILDVTYNNRFISRLCSLLYAICGITSGIYLIQVVIDIINGFILKQ